jgi:arylsulfatase A
MKLHTHEAGFRVPGIMNWKGRIQPGQTVGTAVSSLDFLPTLCHLANVEIPSSLSLDGTLFLPALEGKPIAREKPLIWAYFNAVNDARVAMRDGSWKVLARLNGGQAPKLENITARTQPLVRDAKLTDFEIYNLAVDIGEENNLGRSQPDLAQRMGDKLEAHYRELVSSSHVWKAAVK